MQVLGVLSEKAFDFDLQGRDSSAEHTQCREALNHLAYTIAAGGSGPRFLQGR